MRHINVHRDSMLELAVTATVLFETPENVKDTHWTTSKSGDAFKDKTGLFEEHEATRSHSKEDTSNRMIYSE